TYPADMPGWALLNLISTIGAYILAVSVLIFVWNLVVSWRRGAAAGDNPWQGWTLEWATSSPPPVHNFERVPPIRSHRPLYDLTPAERTNQAGWSAVSQEIPQPTYAPATLALGIIFVLWGLATTWLISAVGLGLIVLALQLWFRQK
ncbi:MAG: hypothetical protein KDE54_31715, partial [Caldilineaceae bacterium]|nr:hypothetical protein [Caldilineaceae bacterium]